MPYAEWVGISVRTGSSLWNEHALGTAVIRARVLPLPALSSVAMASSRRSVDNLVPVFLIMIRSQGLGEGCDILSHNEDDDSLRC